MRRFDGLASARYEHCRRDPSESFDHIGTRRALDRASGDDDFVPTALQGGTAISLRFRHADVAACRSGTLTISRL